MSSLVKVYLWCIFMTTIIGTVYTDNVTNEIKNNSISGGSIKITKPFVSDSELKELITRSKSIFLNGNRLNLGDWFSNINDKVDDEYNTHLKITFTFIKCECADYLKTLTGIVDNLLKYCVTIFYDGDNCLDGVNLLLDLHENISRTMTTLFEIGDRYQNLKRHEQHFLKILLKTYTYINSFKVRGRQNINFAFVMKNIHSSYAQELFFQIRRTVLQITNLFHGFTIEFCFSDVKTNGKNLVPEEVNWDTMNDQQVLTDFQNFLKAVVSFDTDPPYSTIDMDELRLEDCIPLFPTEQNNALLDKYYKLCRSFLKYSYIQNTGDTHMFIYELFRKVQFLYDLESIYEYMLAIYKVIWKLILRETAELWKKDDQSDIEDCEGIISKLKSMGCPIEMIGHFEFVLNVQNYRKKGLITKSNVQKIGETGLNADRHTNVILPEFHLDAKELSLTDLINIVLGNKFKKFWWVFNSLRKESEMNSPSVYNLSLTLAFGDPTYERIKCNKLIDIYINFFIIQSMYDKFLSNIIPDDTENIIILIENYEEIRRHYESFSSMLLEIFEKWNTIDYLENDGDLQNIILATIILLKNEFYTSIDTNKFQNCSQLKELILQKREKSKRIGDYIMNLLDNFQIRHCILMKNRDYVYKNEFNKKKILSLKNIFTNCIENVLNCFQKNNNKSTNFSLKIGDKKEYNYEKILQAGKNDIYGISQLTGQFNINKFETLAKGVYFYWDGEVMSIYKIQTDISNNLLNVSDLIEYQNLYVQWLFYAVYTTWFVVTKQFLSSEDAKFNLTVQDQKCHDSEIDSIIEFNENILSFQNYFQYQKYGLYSQDKILYFNTLCESDTKCIGSNMINILKEEIISPLAKLLGIVKENDLNINNIKDIFNNENNPSLRDILKILSFPINKILSMTDKTFFEHSYHTFCFTTPHY